MKRIFILRHVEEPKQHKYAHISTEIGMTDQGAVRTSMMPELISRLVNGLPYQVHTYTHGDPPVSRSFLTSQLLDADKVLYSKSHDIEELVNNVRTSQYTNIVIIWEHLVIPKIIHLLTGKEVSYDKAVKKCYKKITIKKQRKTTSIVGVPKLTFCNEIFLEKNKEARDYYINFRDDVAYSLVWDIQGHSLQVYPGYLIKRHGEKFKVFKYV
jgi:hypothetical protein